MTSPRASTTASSIAPRRIRWVWRGRIARGYLSLWSGESALGKSTQFCAVAAGLTTGTLEGHLEGKPSRVLIVASEDAREDVWVPRLIVAGADLDLIEFQDHGRDWNLRDGIDLTARAVDEKKPELVFIDSVLEHLPEPKGGENINSPSFIRRSLGPFSELLKTRQIGGLISTHPPKSKGTTFADSVMASAAFVHISRVGLLFAWHPEDHDLPDQDRRRVLMRPPGGSNIGRDPGAFEFRVLTRSLLIEDENEDIPYTTPLTPTDVTYRDLTRATPAEPGQPSLVASARALIDDRLQDGHWHPSMIDELIDEHGYTKATAYRAAERCEKQRASHQSWWWAKQGTPKSTFVGNGENLGTTPPRARTASQPENNPPKTTRNGSTATTSHIPTDTDQSARAAQLVPTSQTPHARDPLPEGWTLEEAESLAATHHAEQAERETAG